MFALSPVSVPPGASTSASSTGSETAPDHSWSQSTRQSSFVQACCIVSPFGFA